MRHLISGLVCWLLAATTGAAADLPDLGKLDRTILKEPAYTCKQPLYGLLVFGPKRLPEVGSAIGKTFKEFKKSVHEISESTKTDT